MDSSPIDLAKAPHRRSAPRTHKAGLGHHAGAASGGSQGFREGSGVRVPASAPSPSLVDAQWTSPDTRRVEWLRYVEHERARKVWALPSNPVADVERPPVRHCAGTTSTSSAARSGSARATTPGISRRRGPAGVRLRREGSGSCRGSARSTGSTSRGTSAITLHRTFTRYGGDEALIVIESGDVHAGELSGRALRLVREWLAEHRDAGNFERGSALEPLEAIDPLP